MEGEPRFLLYRIPDLVGTVLSSSEIEGGFREMRLKTPLCAGHGCSVHCRWYIVYMVVVYIVGGRYCKTENDNPG